MSPTRIRSSWFFAAALCAVACDAAPADNAGDLRLGVLGEDAAGNIYRLRDGVFELDGPTPTTISTEDQPDPVDALSIVLTAGDYEVTLSPGWRLERFDPATELTLDVDALLESPNPTSATVDDNSTTSLAFLFVVADAGPVTLGEGTLEIDIDVDVDEASSCDPTLQDCPAGQGCFPLGEPGALVFTCAQSSGAQAETPCDTSNDCDTGLACLPDPLCGAAENCCLPLCDVADVPPCEGIHLCHQFDASSNFGYCGIGG